jgi:predicted MFS family arabinose efflux permease
MGALVFSHFTIIPLLSPYLVHNVGVPEKHLFLVYLVGGVLTVFTLPYVGRLADRHGRWRILAVLVFVACGVTLMLTNAPRLPLVLTLVLGGLFFVFASGRFVPAQAILSLAVPAAQRGAFMSLTACTRDFASGLVSDLGGRIVTQSAEGAPLQNYHYLGWIAIGFSLLSLAFAARVRRVD